MGKKCKKKTQWRKLSLNEQSAKLTEEGSDEERLEERETTPPAVEPVLPGPNFRRPFNPNFDHRRPFPGDFRRPFHRGGSVERFPKYFGGRPFGPPHVPPFSPYSRRRPWVRGPGHLPRGPLQYENRRWSQDESISFEEGQPVHTVLINNEEYTKIQTPRQEVIFKKSCLDKKSDSMDSICESSTTGLDHQGEFISGEQVSGDGSREDVSCEDDVYISDSAHYDNARGLFVSEPGKPPPVGVVMQQAFPGGPMVPIPVHWTPFIDPILVPGEAAMTSLDPQFTHVFDSKSLALDPAHILPVQHDVNGCPITVQVKVNDNGNPIEIEPSAFPVCLSTLEPYQQEVLLRRSNDLLTGTPLQTKNPQLLDSEPKVNCTSIQTSSINLENNKDKEQSKEHVEDVSSDSQYATMSETSTAPTTPSGELSDDSRCESKEKHLSNSILLDQDSCSYSSTSASSNSKQDDFTSSVILKDSKKLARSDSLVEESSSQCSSCESLGCHESFTDRKELSHRYSQSSNMESDSQSVTNLSTKTSRKKEKKKKTRSLSSESSVGSPTKECIDNKLFEEETCLSKPQTKRAAKKLKRDKKNNEAQKEVNNSESSFANKNFTLASEEIERPALITSVEIDETDSTVSKDCIDSLPYKNVTINDLPLRNEDLSETILEEVENPKVVEEKDSFTEVESDSIVNDPSLKEENSSQELLNNQTIPENLSTIPESLKSNDEQSTDPNAEENLMCKPGYIMVPILTPYYDPAVLYGYPVVGPPENPPDTNYIRRKKKKFRRKYYQENPSSVILDTEMYTGETFVATPEGYMLPVESSQMFQNYSHPQYMYTQHIIPPDEGFVSIDPSHSEVVYEQNYHKSYQLSETAEKAMNSFLNLHDEERKEIEEVLEQLPKIEQVVESCDSGVSESEETANKDKKTQLSQTNSKKSEKGKNKKSKNNTIKEDEKNPKSKKEIKRKSKNATAKKNKTDIIEIQEPDFSSFSSTPRFHVSSDPLTVEENSSKNILENKSKAKKFKNKKYKSSVSEPTSESTNTTKENKISKSAKKTNSLDDSTLLPEQNKSKKKRKNKNNLDTDDKSDVTSQCSIDICSLSESIDQSSEDMSQSQDETEVSSPNAVSPVELEPENSSLIETDVPEIKTQEELPLTATTDSQVVYQESFSDVNHLTQASDDSSLTKIEELHDAEIFLPLPAEEDAVEDNIPDLIDPEISLVEPEITPVEPEITPTDIIQTGEPTAVSQETFIELNNKALKDLNVTEAVRRWIRDVTPEKVFSLTNEHQALILSEIIETSDCEEMDEDEESEPPKNVKGNPLVVSLSEQVLSGSSERVASPFSDQFPSPSPVESDSFSRDRLFSSSSSSSFPPASSLEEIVDDPRLYDPALYSKYYQLGVDIHSSSSSRESTLAPSLESDSPCSLIDANILDEDRVLSVTNHLSISMIDDLPFQCCECSSPSRMEQQVCSTHSSGIGSSLASTPVVSPAHLSLESHSLKKVVEDKLVPPQKAVCCSLM